MITSKRLYELGYLSSMDYYFGNYLTQIAKTDNHYLELALALTHRATMQGHVCYSIADQQPLELEEEGKRLQINFPEIDHWLGNLKDSNLIGGKNDNCPLILDDQNRLYLHRYHDYQTRLVAEIKSRNQDQEVDATWLKTELEGYFKNTGLDEQKLAAINALHHQFSLIAGGPGTGKTTTVAKILVLSYAWFLKKGIQSPTFLLLAPTGKAASRLYDAIHEKLEEMELGEEFKGLIACETSTIHRALQHNWKEPTQFHYGTSNPMQADLVLVDEASMIDLPLLTKLLEAIPKDAKTLLLGDPNQLASVEAGAVFGDLVNQEHYQGYSKDQSLKYQDFAMVSPAKTQKAGFADQITLLTKSFRFKDGKEIGEIAQVIKSGRAKLALSMIQDAKEINLITPNAKDFDQQLLGLCKEGYGGLFKAKSQKEALSSLGRFALLTAHRRGLYGATWANEVLTQFFSLQNFIRQDGLWFHKRPIMITANDYGQSLYNGDTGVIYLNPQATHKEYQANFSKQGGEIAHFNPALLPNHETAFAMTIHKSQGSEFDEIAILLPKNQSQALSNQLIYTALTRAKKKVTILATTEVLTQAIESSIIRNSGITEALWGNW